MLAGDSQQPRNMRVCAQPPNSKTMQYYQYRDEPLCRESGLQNNNQAPLLPLDTSFLELIASLFELLFLSLRTMQSSLRRTCLIALRAMPLQSSCSISTIPTASMPDSSPQLFHTVVVTKQLSSLATTAQWDDFDEHDEDTAEKHCKTCTCATQLSSPSQDCGIPHDTHIATALPPPLPEIKYSVYKRVLPDSLVSLDSKRGRQLLLESLSSSTAESYWSLSQHFSNQSDPAYCGVTSLLMVLNSMGVDPHVRWRGGWRFYGNEETLLDRCCILKERIQRIGIDMEDFARLAKCQGLRVHLHRSGESTLHDFRAAVRHALSSVSSVVVLAFGRQTLGQTGDGHFSPIGAYHAESDMILIMDVARFKYPCYWVSITNMYHAMCDLDPTTQKSRGWFVMDPPKRSASYDPDQLTERRRSASIVPQVGTADVCPVGPIKVEYCTANERNKK